MLLIETSERFLGFGQITRSDIDVTDEFVDIFRNDLELDRNASEIFAIGIAILDGELVYFAKLKKFVVSLMKFSKETSTNT